MDDYKKLWPLSHVMARHSTPTHPYLRDVGTSGTIAYLRLQIPNINIVYFKSS